VGQRPRGPQPEWRPTSPRAAGILADVLARYAQHEQEGTLPRGGRGIFYDLRPNGLGNGVTYRKPDSQHPVSGFGPMEAHPAAVQEVVVMARRAGLIPETWVADTRAPAPILISYDESAAEVARTVAWWAKNAADEFKMDPQTGQVRFVELWCEAEDLAPRIARVAEPWGVPVYSGGGFDGLKGKRAVADRAARRDVPTLVLHIGDRDPHGEMIYAAVSEDAAAWAAAGGTGPDWLEFERLALTLDQAEAHDLLDADGKAEVDSLPVTILDDIVTSRLIELFDHDVLEAFRADEAGQRDQMPDLMRRALTRVLDEGGEA
jgi:hypothetical protein